MKNNIIHLYFCNALLVCWKKLTPSFIIHHSSLIIFFSLFFLPTKIQWLSPTEHDFGTIPQGKTVSERFTFLNVSDEPLVIDNVRTDCSCTAPDWEKSPTSPHEKGVITIEFHADKSGYFQKKISVWIHNQKKPEYLSIEGEVGNE